MPEPEHKSNPPAAQPVVRTPLLTAGIAGLKTVERVEIHRIKLAPNVQVGLHMHPCPVVGIVTHGSILFEVAGQPPRVLHAGDAFFEPANTNIPHFDAQQDGATFVAHYLLGPAETELIRILD